MNLWIIHIKYMYIIHMLRNIKKIIPKTYIQGSPNLDIYTSSKTRFVRVENNK